MGRRSERAADGAGLAADAWRTGGGGSAGSFSGGAECVGGPRPALHHLRGAESASADLRDQRCTSGKDREFGTERGRCHTRACGEVVFLRLFTEDAKNTERAPHGSMLAATVPPESKVHFAGGHRDRQGSRGRLDGQARHPRDRAGIGAEAPKNRKAQEAFQSVAGACPRVNGKIPGGCITRLGDRVKEFVRGNLADKAGEPYAKRMEPLVSRLDGTRDWQPAEASVLLTDIAAVSDSPLSVMLEEIAGGTIQYSPSLKKELENAPWGEALPNGLRAGLSIGAACSGATGWAQLLKNAHPRP